MSETEHRLAVVIPYYQRESGILRRALDSIFAQELPPGLSIHVFIVDDASPLPADGEVAGLPRTGAISLSVHRQSNGGPGAARNAGLDLAQADGGFDFVAFLDSDDEWTPHHLAEAVEALGRGYDFYFCDNGREGAFDRYSQDVPALRDDGEAIAHKADWRNEKGPVLGFPPRALNSEMVETCLSHTSGVVLRSSAIARIRFDNDLRSAGEDHFFWLTLTLSGAKTAISWQRNVLCGRGVNIFFAAFDWNRPETLDRVGNLALFGEKLCRLPDLPVESRGVVRDMRAKYRRAYAFLLVRALLRRQWHRSATLGKLRRMDPLFPLRVPGLFLSMLIDRDPQARQF